MDSQQLSLWPLSSSLRVLQVSLSSPSLSSDLVSLDLRVPRLLSTSTDALPSSSLLFSANPALPITSFPSASIVESSYSAGDKITLSYTSSGSAEYRSSPLLSSVAVSQTPSKSSSTFFFFSPTSLRAFFDFYSDHLLGSLVERDAHQLVRQDGHPSLDSSGTRLRFDLDFL